MFFLQVSCHLNASFQKRERTNIWFHDEDPLHPRHSSSRTTHPAPLSGGGHKGYNTEGVADQYTGCKIEHPSSESGHDKYVSIREPPSLAAPCEYCGVGWGIPLYWWGVQIPPSSDREAPSWEWFVMCFFSPIFSNGRVLEFSRQRVSLYRGKIMWVARGVISKQTCRHSRVRILITSEFLDNIKSHDCNNSKLEV